MWNSSFTFSGDQCCQRSSVGFGGFFASNPGCKFEGFFCWKFVETKKMLHESWRWLAYIKGEGVDSSYSFFFRKLLDFVWTKWTWVERKLNDLSFFWHSGPEPFAKDLTIFAAWIASDEYDRTGHLLNVPMNVYPFMNKRHRMSRFDPQGFLFIRVESWDLVRRSNGTIKSTRGPLRMTGSWS